MRSEKEIRKWRDDMYRTVVMLRQSDNGYADLILLFVKQIDWTLGDTELDATGIIAALNQLDDDAKKLALF